MRERVLAFKKEYIETHLPYGNNKCDRLYNKDEDKDKVFFKKEEEFIIELIDCFGEFIDRESAEKDYDYKQIIPYCVINFGDFYFLTQRTKVQTEKRLHNAYSLGVGGHINPEDWQNGVDYDNGCIKRGLYRELEEELHISVDEFTVKYTGIINENYTDAGKMHLGVVYAIEMKAQNVAIKENEKMTGMWVRKDDLKNYVDKMESWSQIIYNNCICANQ